MSLTSRWKQFLFSRAGLDVYNVVLLLLFFLLFTLVRFTHFLPLLIPAGILLVYGLFRMFSGDRFRREVENARFLRLGQTALRWLRRKHTILSDKDHRYFKCPNCGQPLRVPRGKGKVQVTCRVCGAQFEEKS